MSRAILSALLILTAACGKSPPPDPVMTVDAQAMMEEYKNNEVAADTKFTGKGITVTGVIRELGKEKGLLSNDAYVDLGGFLGPRVRCYFGSANESQFQGLEKGARAAVTGKCEGVHVKLRERLGAETLEDKLKKLGTHTFITLTNCKLAPPAAGKP